MDLDGFGFILVGDFGYTCSLLMFLSVVWLFWLKKKAPRRGTAGFVFHCPFTNRAFWLPGIFEPAILVLLLLYLLKCFLFRSKASVFL